MHRRIAVRIVDAAGRWPVVVVALALALTFALGAFARRLELRSDLLELLPRDSPGFQAFEHQLGRVGGGSTLIVIVSSPDGAKNERFVDDLADQLDLLIASKAPPANLIAYVERGTKDVRAFYEANKWLYADLEDLRSADAELDRQIAVRSGLVEDLEAPDAPAPTAAASPTQPAQPTADGGAPPKKHALGMDDYRARWQKRAEDRDAFPTGYFATKDGKLAGLRIVTSTQLGDARGDALLAAVQRIVARLEPRGRDPSMHVGFTGDVAGAADEKKAIMDDAALATGIAVVVILGVIALYFRSLWSIPIILLPALFGVAAAYAFAEVAFGYINTAGAFLGAIIVGNGINYPIVLLARYEEFRARGMAPDVARREAVVNAFRAELVGACVAAIAYGSLFFTRFRGFSQFGAIGFVGMLVVWASIVPLVPAMIVLVDRVRSSRSPLASDGTRWLTRVAALGPTRWPRSILAIGAAITVLAASRIPAYLVDPWEYDFGKLGSRRTDVSGAGEWSNKANLVFGGKMNVAGALMLADTKEQVPLVKAKILANDALDPEGPMIAEITTLWDMLPGTAAEQEEKLTVLSRIRDRLSPRVLSELDDDERKSIDEMRPPEALQVLADRDLPPLVRRRFSENDGRLGTAFYVKPRNDVVFADGHNHLRLSATTDDVRLDDGTVVMTASRSTIFAEMLRSLRRDGPLASLIASVGVIVVVIVAARDRRLVLGVLAALAVGVAWLLGGAAFAHVRLNYVNFIALPITLGIGCEYPFNIADRVRLLGGDVSAAVSRSGGAVLLCSLTTTIGYGSLLLSDVQALESFGKLAVCGELACVFAAVFLLPSLLVVLQRGKRVPHAPIATLR